MPARIEVPDVSLTTVLHDAIGAHPHRPALDFYGATTTYAQLGEQVAAAAAALAAAGVGAGDRVALILPSCPQAVVSFYAVLELGGVVVEQNPLSTTDELQRTFTDHGARVAVVWDKAADALAAVPLEHEVTLLTVDMSRALPLGKRLAMRLPIRKAREVRAAMIAAERRALVGRRRAPAPAGRARAPPARRGAH